MNAFCEDESGRPGPPAADFSIDVEYMQSSFTGGKGNRASYREYSGGFSRRFLFLGIDRRAYDFAGADDNGRLWDDLTGITAGLRYFRPLDEARSFMAFLSARAGFEDSISSRALSYSPRVMWTFSNLEGRTFYLGGAVIYSTVDYLIHPVMGLSWDDDREKGLSVTIGYPTMARYRFNRALSANVHLRPDSRIYRLSGENALAPGGYLETHDWKAGFDIDFAPAENIIFSLGINRNFERTLHLYDHTAEELPFPNTGDAWSFSLKTYYTF